jgi:hypothetical protein
VGPVAPVAPDAGVTVMIKVVGAAPGACTAIAMVPGIA